jgi:hypothetical protein
MSPDSNSPSSDLSFTVDVPQASSGRSRAEPQRKNFVTSVLGQEFMIERH